MKEKTKATKDGATRQEEWRKREAGKGRTRRFDRKVTPEEYDELAELLKRRRGI